MGKGKITNWPEYNKALKVRGSITFWIDDNAVDSWYNTEQSGGRGRSTRYTDTAIETSLMVKSVFSLSLRAVEGFLNSIFGLLQVPFQSPDYTLISKRAQTVKPNYRPKTRSGDIHIVVDSTGLKVFGEGEWKVQKHGKEGRKVWRKLHLAVDADSHEVVSAEISLDWVHDAKVLPALFNPLRRQIKQVSADGAYDTKDCYDVISKKDAIATIPPRSNAALWEEGHPRNEAVGALHDGKLEEWKTESNYHKRSVAETAMYRYKQLIGDKLRLRNYDAQAGEIYTAVKALNKITSLGMPKRNTIVG